ncbi:MAG: LacI family DNA-binding transcriptional regulator [Oscillospiraceae bacterium]
MTTKTTVNMTQKRNVQLDDIAAELGLSKSTVSRAISGKGRISAETRNLVNEYIKKINYRPNIIAKSLSECKTYNIGVVLPMDGNEIEAPFFQTCLAGISRECAKNNYDAVVIATEGTNLARLERVVRNRKVDGVIIARPIENGEMERFLLENEMPFVAIGQSVVEGALCVDNAHKEGCRELTGRLLDSVAPERMALLMDDMHFMVNRSRYEGFVSAFSERGAKINEQLVFTEIDAQKDLLEIAQRILKNGAQCIVCGDDIICFRLMSELTKKGVSIPKNIKVASFYDSAYIDSFLPSIAALRFSASELGQKATKLIINKLNGIECSSVELDFEIIMR